jgi:hypothetical protein
VLTEDVKFLGDADRERVLDKEREVVAGLARAVRRCAPTCAQRSWTSR